MNDAPDTGKKLAFEEFSLYYESTERVTDRRMSANKWGYSICAASLIANAAIINWGLAKPQLLLPAIVAVILLSSSAAIYCTMWIGQIRDLKELNHAKFEVLNAMAPYVSFGESIADPRVSYEPFSREWKILESRQALRRISDSSIVALRSSNIEYFLPRTFRVFFILIVAGVLVFVALNWATISEISSFDPTMLGSTSGEGN